MPERKISEICVWEEHTDYRHQTKWLLDESVQQTDTEVDLLMYILGGSNFIEIGQRNYVDVHRDYIKSMICLHHSKLSLGNVAFELPIVTDRETYAKPFDIDPEDNWYIPKNGIAVYLNRSGDHSFISSSMEYNRMFYYSHTATEAELTKFDVRKSYLESLPQDKLIKMLLLAEMNILEK